MKIIMDYVETEDYLIFLPESLQSGVGYIEGIGEGDGDGDGGGCSWGHGCGCDSGGSIDGWGEGYYHEDNFLGSTLSATRAIMIEG